MQSEYGSTFQAMLSGESNAEHSSVTMKVQLLFRTKRKQERKATEKKTAIAPMKDCTNSVTVIVVVSLLQ